MRSLKAGAFLGALWLLGGCVVADDSGVNGSKTIAALTGREIYDLCEWAKDYMGGLAPNAPDAPDDWAAGHRCAPTPEQQREGEEITYIYWVHENCPPNLAAQAADGCQLTVDDFESWVKEIADAPCEPLTYTLGECSLEWGGRDESNVR